MDAKELLQEWKERCNRLPRTAEEEDYQTILRALSLLAAAEANDGTTPETDAARLTINQRRMIAECRGVVSEMVEASVARRLERERNGLARELAAARRSSAFWKAEHIAGNDVIERLQAELAKLRRHAEAMADEAKELNCKFMSANEHKIERVTIRDYEWERFWVAVNAYRRDFPKEEK